MHGNHGGHHHHEYENEDTQSLRSDAESRFGRVISDKIAIRIFSSTAATLAMPQLYPSIYRQVSNQGRRVALTFLTSFVGMWAWDSLKSSANTYIDKFSKLQSSLVKHSTPLTRKFFFRNENAADKVTLLGIFVNVLLSISKFWGGITFNSAVLVSDAGHSLSDLFSDFITLWAVQVSRIPADDDHPYGHGKFESVGSLFLSLTLLLTGASVGSWSYGKMQAVMAGTGVDPLLGAAAAGAGAGAVSAATAPLQTPRRAALLFALLSIVSKEWIFRVTRRVGLALNSQIIVANAWHHRSDAFSSIISLISIGLAITFPQLIVMDSAAGIFVAGMICLTGTEILMESIKELTDTEDMALKETLRTAALAVPGVDGIASLRSRTVGSGSSLVDLTIQIDPTLSLSAANAIAEKARFRLSMAGSGQVKEVFVRTQPLEKQPFCPLLITDQKDVAVIERDISNSLQDEIAEIVGVTRVTVHFVGEHSGVKVDAFVRVRPDLTMMQASRVAERARELLSRIGLVSDSHVYIDVSV
jgi:cation diffusion facilitator family transporter